MAGVTKAGKKLAKKKGKALTQVLRKREKVNIQLGFKSRA